MYAIIATGGKQYKVSEGDIIDIEKIEGESGAAVTFDKVICIGGETMKVGADVASATVTGTVMDQGKGKKVVVYHYKRKSINPSSAADMRNMLPQRGSEDCSDPKGMWCAQAYRPSSSIPSIVCRIFCMKI